MKTILLILTILLLSRVDICQSYYSTKTINTITDTGAWVGVNFGFVPSRIIFVNLGSSATDTMYVVADTTYAVDKYIRRKGNTGFELPLKWQKVFIKHCSGTHSKKFLIEAYK